MLSCGVVKEELKDIDTEVMKPPAISSTVIVKKEGPDLHLGTSTTKKNG